MNVGIRSCQLALACILARSIPSSENAHTCGRKCRVNHGRERPLVRLERVVVSILPGPELHVLRAELAGRGYSLLIERDRLPSQARIGIDERTLLEPSAVAGR